MDIKLINKTFHEIQHNSNLPFDQIDQWTKEAKFDELVEIAKLVDKNWNASPSQNWRYIGTYLRIIDSLSLTKDKLSIQGLLDVIKIRPQSGGYLSRIAACLASTQDMTILDSYVQLTETEFIDLWANLVQELVIRGHDVRDYPNLIALWDRLKRDNYPLTTLPLELFEPEAQIQQYTRSYSISGSGTSLPFGPLTANDDVKFTIPPFDFASIDPSIIHQHIYQAVENWRLESNGKIEVRQFTMQPATEALAHDEISLMFKLGLDCLHGVSSRSLFIKHTQATDAVNILFSAAANGGAYNHGSGNAYGRLYMWQSLAGLMNLPVGTPISTLAGQAAKSKWLIFDAESNWFYRVAWDIGIVAINPDRNVISVLAATDTD